MRKLLLAAVALTGFTALAASGANAQPRDEHVRMAPERPMVTKADYYHNHQRYHHRHYEHGHWRYWN
jgi:hypothetical protein